MSTAESMAAGAIAGCAVVMATHPIWTVNVIFFFFFISLYLELGYLILVI